MYHFVLGGNNDPMECEIKLEPPGTPEREAGGDMEAVKGVEDSDDVKKKKRKPYRPGRNQKCFVPGKNIS